jgi:hypothetical protein
MLPAAIQAFHGLELRCNPLYSRGRTIVNHLCDGANSDLHRLSQTVFVLLLFLIL